MSDVETGMARLRDSIKELASLIPHDNPVVFLDYPVYLNVGDLLIEQGTDRFLEAFGYRVEMKRSAHDFNRGQAAKISPRATILLQGGGNFGDLYELHQRFREDVISQCRQNRIVVLPQTVHFESTERLADCARLYAAHPDLHICTRDLPSYELVRRNFANPVYLFPDMAHFLWDEYASYRRIRGAAPPLFFVRSDKEGRSLAYAGLENVEPVDWLDVISWPERRAFSLLYRLHAAHDRILPNHDIQGIWRRFREHLTRKAANMVAAHDKVVTNRLHMALLGLLLGREVAMGDNSYGKLSAYHACWLADIGAIEMVNSRVSVVPEPASVSIVRRDTRGVVPGE